MENIYKQKCAELRKRITAIEKVNDVLSICLAQRKQSVQRLRLERAFLYEELEKRLPQYSSAKDYRQTPSPILSPKLKPLPNIISSKDAESISTKKTQKEPPLPKRPTNPFIRFCEAQRETLRAELHYAGEPGELNRALGQKWQALDEEQRRPYIELYEQDKLRYEKEKIDYERDRNEIKCAERDDTSTAFLVKNESEDPRQVGSRKDVQATD